MVTNIPALQKEERGHQQCEGTLISLDRASSSKLRFDIGRVLISAAAPGVISAIVPVSVDGNNFQVRVAEEVSANTIFSRGFDRARADDLPMAPSGAQEWNQDS
ncbi:hypothetical protein Ancab_007941 [Ancistrocladus abbreviatus]